MINLSKSKQETFQAPATLPRDKLKRKSLSEYPI